MMGPEDQNHHQRSRNSGGSSSCKVEPLGGRSSCKRPKSKRLPQRGLGVAQLEKIRLEEQQQQKVVSVVVSSAAQSSTTANTNHKPSFLSLPIPNFSPTVQSGSSSSSPNVSANSVPLIQQPPGNGAADYRNWHELEWKHTSGSDPDLGFRSSFYMPHESSEPIWPLPSLIQRAHQFQQCSSSMMNLAASTSSSASSLMNYQMEPPSNQSYYGNALVALMPEEEKMVGRKRLYQFTLDNLPAAPSFAYKVPPVVPFLDKSYELPSTIDVGLPSFDLGNKIFRELPPCPTPTMLESYTDLTFKENGLSNGDFLTLAPPTALCKSSKLKQPSPHFGYYNHEPPPGFESLTYKGNSEDSNAHLGTNKVHGSMPYFSFLPPAVVQAGHGTGGLSNRKGGEVGGNVDLNLKL